MENTKTSPIKKVQFDGMAQFRPPLNYELIGRKFELVMDSGYDCILEFIDKKTLRYGLIDEKMKTYDYECLKVDDDTYFVNFEVVGAPIRTGITFVLDLEQSLVTENYATIGENPRYPKMPKTRMIFGAIRKEDGSISRIRHGYTADNVGHSILWEYGNMSVVHIYVSERYYRLSLTDELLAMIAAKGKRGGPGERMLEQGRVYEEPVDCIKVKDGIYIFSMTEEMTNRNNGDGSNLFFLMNLNRMYDVGRSFAINKEGKDENYTYGAFGTFVDKSELIAMKSTEFVR